jgi:hypothetical protein
MLQTANEFWYPDTLKHPVMKCPPPHHRNKILGSNGICVIFTLYVIFIAFV